jgi:ankyrin repeat protein
LIKANADIYAVNYSKMSVLHYAANADAYEVSKYLLENGCDVNAVDDKNRSLWWDVKSDKMARLLIGYGIKLDGKDIFGTPDLLSIVYNRRVGVIREFIDAGGDINVTNQKLENALFITTQRDFNERQRGDVNYDENKNKNVVRLLIDGGIDIKQKNLRGEDALGVATVEMKRFILDYIERQRNNPELFEFVKSRAMCKD